LLRQGHGVQTAALVHVNKIQAHCVVANADFTGAGLTHSNGYQFELFGPAMLVNPNGARGACGHGFAL
jgi:hypothetical protein